MGRRRWHNEKVNGLVVEERCRVKTIFWHKKKRSQDIIFEIEKRTKIETKQKNRDILQFQLSLIKYKWTALYEVKFAKGNKNECIVPDNDGGTLLFIQWKTDSPY